MIWITLIFALTCFQKTGNRFNWYAKGVVAKKPLNGKHCNGSQRMRIICKNLENVNSPNGYLIFYLVVCTRGNIFNELHLGVREVLSVIRVLISYGVFSIWAVWCISGVCGKFIKNPTFYFWVHFNLPFVHLDDKRLERIGIKPAFANLVYECYP